MIDFTKPMRVNGAEIQDDDFVPGVLRKINGVTHFINQAGNVFRLDFLGITAENTPPEPVKRYQAQYIGGFSGDWRPERIGTFEHITACLIETDHGEGATPRYTYEREDAE